MGAKQSRSSSNVISLNPGERKRLTTFIESKGNHAQLNEAEIEKLWKDLLVPDLLKSYIDFVMKQDTSKKNYILIDEFAIIYSALVRGDSEDKAGAIAGIIGSQKNAAGQESVSFNSLCKYLTDVLESYFKILELRNDVNYKSWTHTKNHERAVMEQTIRGVCSDLPRQNDEVLVDAIEHWLNHTGMVSVLHSYMLGSLYDLEPDVKASIIPQAILPSTKSSTFLDLSQIVYLNSCLPSPNKFKWRLLFSTSTHGESFSVFVKSISNEGPVLVVIKSNDNSTFGGFVSENISPGPRWVGSEDSFLFTLSPSVSMFPATGYNDHYVYLNMSQSSLPNGLGMGGQYGYWGMWIDSHFGNGECSESCTTYKNYKMLATKKKFHIRTLEIWGVGDRPPTAEERGERSTEKGSAMEKDSTATHILEMSGRTMYSKTLGKNTPEGSNRI